MVFNKKEIKTKKSDAFNLKNFQINNMEKLDIQKRANEIKTVQDLAILLNKIKEDEYGINKYRITEALLRYFCNSKVQKRYKTFLIRKKSGGKREINAPCPQLEVILHCLNIVFKSLYNPSPSAMGFAEGKCIVDNSILHVGHNYVFNIDLENFFPSIPQARVRGRLMVKPFCFTEEVANVVAGLCCNTNADRTCNVLPQGSPASPLLTNAICDKLDMLMRGVAKRFNIHYSRYADDMTFSSMHNVYQEGSDFRKEILRIITEQGFKMNDKKTRLLKKGQRQEVTGLTVNEKVNVTREYVRNLRCVIHIWETQGYNRAYAYFYLHYKHEKGYIKKGEPVMENVIEGKLNYLGMVKGKDNDCYQKLISRYNKLRPTIYDNMLDSYHSFVQSYTVQEFMDSFKTKVCLETTPKNKLVAKCVIANSDKYIHIDNETKKMLLENIQQTFQNNVVESDRLADCYITLCSKTGQNYWLITNKKQDTIWHGTIDANDIDKLLQTWEGKGINDAAQQMQNMITSDNTDDKAKNKTSNNKSEEIVKKLIYFFQHYKMLTKRQKAKRDELLVKNYEINGNGASKPSPMDTYKFLSLYNSNDGGLKNLTHDFNDGYIEYDSFMKKCKDEFDKGCKDFPGILKQTHLIKRIQEFTFSTNPNWSISKFDDNTCQNYFCGWNEPSFVKWYKDNKIHPSRSTKWNSEMIIPFKESIQVRADTGNLIRLINNIKTAVFGENSFCNFCFDKIEEAQFYTDVDALGKAINKIFKTISYYAGINFCTDIIISYSYDNDYKTLKIKHKDSKATKPHDDRDFLGGDLKDIRNSLWGLCNYYIKADFSDGSYTKAILTDKKEADVKLDEPVNGFEHILKFY